MNEDERQSGQDRISEVIANAMNRAKPMEKGPHYLMIIDKGAAPKDVVDHLREELTRKGISVSIILVHPLYMAQTKYDAVALYRMYKEDQVEPI